MLVELLCGLLFLICFLVIGLRYELISALCLSAILICITFVDIDTFTIPNGFIIFGMIAGVVFIALGVLPDQDAGYKKNIIDALLGVLAGAVPLIIIDLGSRLILKRDGMGGGDMKLMAMVGLFLGWKLILAASLLGVYAGALYGIYYMTKRRRTGSETKDDKIDNDMEKEKEIGHVIPFGPFLAIGSFVSMLFGLNIIKWYMNTFL